MTKQEQNAANAAKTASEFRFEGHELIELLGRKMNVLAAAAQADAEAGKADWRKAGSLGGIVSQLLDALDGFELPKEDAATVARIRATHESNWS